ncbi:MAG: Rsd/AlgQ family anti-sigma factor [Gammaproteobacteria bacterium]|nr:Rsd/AlgQ family anti-sigma factor [Gammaproteobacteria bacterium]
MNHPGSPTTTIERRDNSRMVIDNLLQEREQLLVLYCKVAGLEPYTEETPVERMVGDFCQILVDYVAAVHFEVFSRLSEGSERRRSVLDAADRNYDFVAHTTQQAVDFNDKYDGSDAEHLKGSLPGDLSHLGEVLAERFEKEDEVFSALLDKD